jgi:hypothetical protein
MEPNRNPITLRTLRNCPIGRKQRRLGRALRPFVKRIDPMVPAHLQQTFPRLQIQPPIVLPRQNYYSRASEIIGYAIVPPR